MQDVALDFYTGRIKFYTASLLEIDKKIRQISYQRLLSILLFAAGVYFGITTNSYIFLPAIIFFIFFVVFVNRHTKVFQERILLKELLILNQKEAAFLSGDKTVFDAGLDFDPGRTGSHHLYALDLDIFGVGSLFQSINRTSTQSAREHLSALLLSPSQNESDITLRKSAIHDLRYETEWRQKFYAIGTQVDEKPNDYLKIRE